MPATFTPEMRLHDGRDYSRVFNRQQKAAGRHVVLLLRPRAPGSRARLGIMISAKTAPLAVRRHQLKRWVRELFRLQLHVPLAAHDAVVLFRCDPPEDSHALIDRELLGLVSKALSAPAVAGGGRGPRRGGGLPAGGPPARRGAPT